MMLHQVPPLDRPEGISEVYADAYAVALRIEGWLLINFFIYFSIAIA
jgi:hypothetical protein